MAIIKVVCGIIFREGQIFLCRKKPHKALGGFWEFPGGKVEENEKYEDTLERELAEELGMKVKVKGHFTTVLHDYEKFTIELIAYSCDFVEATFTLTDHDAYEWLYIKDLFDFDLAPADIPIVEKLNRYLI